VTSSVAVFEAAIRLNQSYMFIIIIIIIQGGPNNWKK